MTQLKLIGTAYYKDGTRFSNYVCTNCGSKIQTFGENVYPNLRECPICHEKCNKRKDNVSKVAVKKISKCCETCNYSVPHNIVYLKDGVNLQNIQKLYCYAEKEPIEVFDNWGTKCRKWKPLKKEVSNQ